LEPAPQANPPRLHRDVARSLALKAGFTEAGLVSLPHEKEERDAGRFQQWLKEGRAGTMSYLERTDDAGAPVRSRPQIPFPWAQSAILCSASYNGSQALSTDSAPPDAGWIARYAQSGRIDPDGQHRPSDYHKILLKRLRALEAHLQQEYGAFESRAYVDTGPVVERSLAVAAGLGWQAKNTCLIHPKHGSYTFLAVLLTSLPVQKVEAPTAPLAAQAPTPIPDRCGSCRRCIEACPTDALIAPYKMDARLCISYLTIEHRGPIEPALMEQMGRQVFGCDICQDVCPWNRKAPVTSAPEFLPREGLVNPALDWLAEMQPEEFREVFRGSPIRRAKLSGLRRNAVIAMGNSGDKKFIPLLKKLSEDSDAVVAAHACWAAARLEAAADSER